MKIEKHVIIGCFASFVETGTTFGSAPVNTVSSALFPSTTTYASAWQSLGDVLDASPEKKTEDYGDNAASTSGGYRFMTDEVTLQDTLKLSLSAHTEFIHRLVWGLKSKITDGTPVAPFLSNDRFVEGWLSFTGRARDGSDRFVGALYVRLRLDGNPKWSKDPTKPTLKAEIIPTSIASLVPTGVVA